MKESSFTTKHLNSYHWWVYIKHGLVFQCGLLNHSDGSQSGLTCKPGLTLKHRPFNLSLTVDIFQRISTI